MLTATTEPVWSKEHLKTLVMAIGLSIGLILALPATVRSDSSPVLSALPIFGPIYDAFASGEDSPSGYVQKPINSILLQSSNYAADVLHENLCDRLSIDDIILVSVFTELGDLNKTSPFGRLASNQIASRLAQHGYQVSEVRLRQDIAFREQQGEFMLSRNPDKLAGATFDAQAALVGHYQQNGDRVFVSAKVVRLTDRSILASCEYYVPLASIQALMRSQEDERQWSQATLGRKPALATPTRYDLDCQPTKPAASRPVASKQNAAPKKARDPEPRQEDKPGDLPGFSASFKPGPETDDLK